MAPPRRRPWLAIIGPGLLVAATGVGAGVALGARAPAALSLVGATSICATRTFAIDQRRAWMDPHDTRERRVLISSPLQGSGVVRCAYPGLRCAPP